MSKPLKIITAVLLGVEFVLLFSIFHFADFVDFQYKDAPLHFSVIISTVVFFIITKHKDYKFSMAAFSGSCAALGIYIFSRGLELAYKSTYGGLYYENGLVYNLLADESTPYKELLTVINRGENVISCIFFLVTAFVGLLYANAVSELLKGKEPSVLMKRYKHINIFNVFVSLLIISGYVFSILLAR